MIEFNQNYDFNIFYICVLVLIYNICNSNYAYAYMNIIFGKLYLLNETSIIIIIKILGLYLFLNKISFEVNIKWSIKYK